MTDRAGTDITGRLCEEFRVRDWWPGMDSFDSARGDTVPHPVATEAVAEIEALRQVVRFFFEGNATHITGARCADDRFEVSVHGEAGYLPAACADVIERALTDRPTT